MIGARLKTVLVAGLLLGAAAIALTLTEAPPTIARVNTTAHESIGTTNRQLLACQSEEALPRGTSAIRLRVETFVGPRVTLEVLEHGHVITRGERESGWTAGAVTVPVQPLSSTRSGVELCFSLFLNGDETADIVGEPTTGALAARERNGPLPGRVRVEYLRPGSSSWWSRIPEVARRMGLGRAWPGTWNVLLVLALMGGVVFVTSRLILREPG